MYSTRVVEPKEATLGQFGQKDFYKDLSLEPQLHFFTYKTSFYQNFKINAINLSKAKICL